MFWGKKIVFFFLIFLAGFAVSSAQVDNGSVRLDLFVPGCNINGICELALGEDAFSCPADCLAGEPEPPGGGGGGGGGTPVEYPLTPTATSTIADLRVEVGSTTPSAVITWMTEIPSISKLSWGLNPEYSGGSISEFSFSKNHRIFIEDLKPDTLYFFKIEGKDVINNFVGLAGLTFHTHSDDQNFSPPNVSAFRARVIGPELVLLTWQNFSPQYAVRIVRSDRFYPLSPQEGKVVYEGKGSKKIDSDVKRGKTYYYTAFVDDGNGNYSSGVLAAVYLPLPESEVSLDDPVRVSPPIDDTISTTTVSTPSTPISLPFRDIIFIQNEKRVPFAPVVELDAMLSTTLILPDDKVAGGTKIIVASVTLLSNPSESTLFFLRHDELQKGYRAIMGPLLEPGTYSIAIVGLNERQSQVFRIDGFIKALSDAKKGEKLLFLGLTVDNLAYKIVVFACIILAILILIFLARKPHKKRRV